MPIKYGMDKNEFRRKLEEVAIIKEKKPVKTAGQPRWAKEVIVEIDEDTGEEIEIEKEITENPTLGIELVKIKEIIKLCELGCGNVIADQIIEKRFCLSPKPHWRTKCQNCGKYVSPDGACLIKDSHKIANEFSKYFKLQTNVRELISFNKENTDQNK